MPKKKAKRHADEAPSRDDAHAPSVAAWALHATDRAHPLGIALGAGGSPAERMRPEPPQRHHRVAPGTRVRLAAIDPDDTGPYRDKQDGAEELERQRERISALQERLYAEHRQSLLVVLQSIDTGGKDGTIRSVFQGVNPQGCQVWSFKTPSQEERDHDFLWRYHARAPGLGMMAVFNRSHYEDVLIVRVKGLVPEEVWRPRYGVINAFEHMLTLNRTTVLKFFLHISKNEQKRRLEKRLRNPDKHWKFNRADLVERAAWDTYMAAYEDALSECATAQAPWYVVPANKKWYRNLVVAQAIADALEAMDPRYPEAEKGLDEVVVPD